jgi:thioredoxin-related protein
MEQRWTKYLEMTTNVAVLLVAVALLGAIVSTRFARRGQPRFENGLQRGQVLTRLPSIDYLAAPQTMLLVLSTKCSYCEQSLPFYKRLVEEQRKAGRRTRIVAVFPNTETEVEQYNRHNQLDVESVAAVNSGTLNVTGTPTLILVDSVGKVRDFWVGMLSKDDEQQVINAVIAR